MNARNGMKERIRQQGAALFVALIILLIVSMMGVSAMKSGILSEKMAFNTQARELSFQAAETAINGVIDNARSSGEFVSKLLGTGGVHTHCVNADNRMIEGACPVGTTFDQRSVLQGQAESRFDRQRVVFDNDASAIVDYQFLSIGEGKFARADLPFKNRNLQEWRKLGPSGGPFSVGNPTEIGEDPPENDDP